MDMVPVVSSNIKAIGYHETLHILAVHFHNEHVYEYPNIDVQVYKDFLASESKGKFFQVNIKNRPCRRISP